jgi:hypothetical protein
LIRARKLVTFFCSWVFFFFLLWLSVGPCPESGDWRRGPTSIFPLRALVAGVVAGLSAELATAGRVSSVGCAGPGPVESELGGGGVVVVD